MIRIARELSSVIAKVSMCLEDSQVDMWRPVGGSSLIIG